VVTELVDHKYSKTEIDGMYPFERDIIISIINQKDAPAGQAPEVPTEF
jgi:hypothetical protein